MVDNTLFGFIPKQIKKELPTENKKIIQEIKPEEKPEAIRHKPGKKVPKKVFIADLINLNGQQNSILHHLAENHLPLDIWSIANYWGLSEEIVKKELEFIGKFHEIKFCPQSLRNGILDGYLLKNNEKYWKIIMVNKKKGVDSDNL